MFDVLDSRDRAMAILEDNGRRRRNRTGKRYVKVFCVMCRRNVTSAEMLEVSLVRVGMRAPPLPHPFLTG